LFHQGEIKDVLERQEIFRRSEAAGVTKHMIWKD